MRQDFYEEYRRIELEHWWFIARRRIILTVLTRWLRHPQAELGVPPRDNRSQPVSNPRLLDVGVGSGVMLRYLEAFGQVVGCDRERAALVPSFLKAVPPNGVGGGTQVVQAEAEHLPFKPESLDLVTMLDLLEHIADDRGVLSDVGRILRPKGILCVTVPVYRWLWGNQDLISRHVRRYQPGELERKIEAAGLCILYQTYFNTFLFPVVAMIRLIRRGRALLGGCYAGLDPDRLPSDFSMTKPGRLNDALAWIFSQEARWLRRWRFPMGVSLLCLAQKPAAPLEGPLPLAQELNS